jgi:hypothetical protein
MHLLIDDKIATVLDKGTIEKVLNLYPEEEFAKRPIFAKAFEEGSISYQDLRKECERIIIPWQLFLLEEAKLDEELARIENQRHKVSKRLLAKRTGTGTVTSKRILDRLLRLQTYLSENHSGRVNRFCGSLKGRTVASAASHIFKHFGVSPETLRRKNKAAALDYLIEKFEEGGINVCQGVLTNKILPHLSDSRSVYKNTSGFVIKDGCFPFAFIPSEINPDEREGRQIFTLVFLIALIGLEAYDYQIEKDFKVSMLFAVGKQRVAYNIASEFLLPYCDTESLVGTKITGAVRDELAKRHKITPTAVVVILRKRGLLDPKQYDELMPPVLKGGAKSVARTPKIEASVRKFNGKFAYDFINADYSGRKITSVRAQYLLFGSINKKAFRAYRTRLGL